MAVTFPQARSRTQSPGRAYSWIKTLLICPNTQIEQLPGQRGHWKDVSNITGCPFYQESRDGRVGVAN
jgi:hypothetical protein